MVIKLIALMFHLLHLSKTQVLGSSLSLTDEFGCLFTQLSECLSYFPLLSTMVLEMTEFVVLMLQTSGL